MSSDVAYCHFYKESKHFGLLPSVFPPHAVYLVNKVFSKSLLFLQPLYVYQRLYFCSYFKKTNGDIATSFYLILIPGDHTGDNDDDNEMSSDVTFCPFYKESKHFGLLPSVFPSHAVYLLVNKVFSKSLLFLQPLYVYQRLYFCSYSKRQMVILIPVISSSFQVITQVTMMMIMKCHPMLPSVVLTKKVSTLAC